MTRPAGYQQPRQYPMSAARQELVRQMRASFRPTTSTPMETEAPVPLPDVTGSTVAGSPTPVGSQTRSEPPPSTS